MNNTKLTLKQSRFVSCYLTNGNATQAIIDAGYKIKNRSVARSMGSEYLAKPCIKSEIRACLVAFGLSPRNVAEKLSKAIDIGLESKDATLRDVIKGLEIAMKLHGYY